MYVLHKEELINDPLKEIEFRSMLISLRAGSEKLIVPFKICHCRVNKLVIVHCFADARQVAHDSVGIASVCEGEPCDAPFHFLKSIVKSDFELAQSHSCVMLSHQAAYLRLCALTRNRVASRA